MFILYGNASKVQTTEIRLMKLLINLFGKPIRFVHIIFV